MSDREKVKKGLENCSVKDANDAQCRTCPYSENGFPCDVTRLFKDALELLKEG